MEITALLPLFFACLFLMLKPGPYILTMVSLSAAGHYKSMFLFWIGYYVGAVILYVFLLKTLSLLPTGFGMIFIFMKATAACIFISMGINGLKNSLDSAQKEAEDTKERITHLGGLAKLSSGIALALSNPFDIVFVITVIPALVGTTIFSLLDISFVMAAIFLADIAVLIVYCLPVIFIRNFLTPQLLNRVKTVASIAMVTIGLYIFSTIILRWDLIQSNLLSTMS
ncbi:MAG: hypothetical protein CMH30_01210 [Micavibrio sp.]|nr:hypothetical protein [Micavibrio sp.]|tara:strand:+ start:4446 stop:5123 length:678 start_codon:yes stop_codon:yes gene_type:complete